MSDTTQPPSTPEKSVEEKIEAARQKVESSTPAVLSSEKLKGRAMVTAISLPSRGKP